MEEFDFELNEDDLIFVGGTNVKEMDWLESMGLLETQEIKVPTITVNIQMG